jgi:hypothetical protein
MHIYMLNFNDYILRKIALTVFGKGVSALRSEKGVRIIRPKPSLNFDSMNLSNFLGRVDHNMIL